ncbi:hypothetical protein ACLOJK_012386 [Asimina triloba]
MLSENPNETSLKFEFADLLTKLRVHDAKHFTSHAARRALEREKMRSARSCRMSLTRMHLPFPASDANHAMQCGPHLVGPTPQRWAERKHPRLFAPSLFFRYKTSFFAAPLLMNDYPHLSLSLRS